ncbi:50S ribosomal protein L25/general stress protein Ctc [Candidatus Fermentibacteria bacterium]|nr:50S ribosomal protein L25/general stress protein Ctc [Candidatus Fermentibacteria bacterium]
MAITLKVENRERIGTREAKRHRRQGLVPAIVYGREAEQLSITVREQEFMDKIGYSPSTKMISLLDKSKKKTQVIVKDVQWHMLTDRPMHIDFLRVSADQRITVPVILVLEGTPEGVTMGGVLEQVLRDLELEVKVSDIPEKISVDVTELGLGDSLHVGDLSLPEEVLCHTPEDSVVATVVAPSVVVEEEKEEEEEEILEGVVEGEEPAEVEEGEEEEPSEKEAEETPEED